MSGTAPKTAFVFAGGGSFGAVQVGMLRSLVAHGLRADMVVGSSVGAMNGAYYAVAPTVDGGDRLAAIWRGLRRRNVFPIAWRTLLGLPFRRDFLVGSEGLRRLVHTHLPFRNLEDAAIPLHVAATNILSGEAVVLSAGSGADAILASTAIPAAFAPVQFGGRHLADGAITSCTPVRVAVEKGAKRLDRAADGLCLRPRSPTLWRHRQRAACAHLADRPAGDSRA
ncbi:MAG: patatin-like phospholipase family protein [Methyloceanibacter sp.]